MVISNKKRGNPVLKPDMPLTKGGYFNQSFEFFAQKAIDKKIFIYLP